MFCPGKSQTKSLDLVTIEPAVAAQAYWGALLAEEDRPARLPQRKVIHGTAHYGSPFAKA
jgi:hypothetical protein